LLFCKPNLAPFHDFVCEAQMSRRSANGHLGKAMVCARKQKSAIMYKKRQRCHNVVQMLKGVIEIEAGGIDAGNVILRRRAGLGKSCPKHRQGRNKRVPARRETLGQTFKPNKYNHTDLQ
jgi:hypothetical protein